MSEIKDSSWISLALMRIGTAMATVFDRQFAELGVNQAQFRLLLAVWQAGGAEGILPSQLAEHMLLARGTVSVMSERMIKRGWLERLPGPDRRSHRLVLTAEGGRVLEEVGQHATQLGDETFASLSAAELRQIKTTLQQIEARLHEAKP